MLKYEKAEELNVLVRDLVATLRWKHLDPGRILCIRSRGTSSHGILARCHGLPRAIQAAMDAPAIYVIEAIAEAFDKLDEEERIKVMIHELLHIPRAFGGGLLGHKHHVTKRKVEKHYKDYVDARNRRQCELKLDI